MNVCVSECCQDRCSIRVSTPQKHVNHKKAESLVTFISRGVSDINYSYSLRQRLLISRSSFVALNGHCIMQHNAVSHALAGRHLFRIKQDNDYMDPEYLTSSFCNDMVCAPIRLAVTHGEL